MRVAVVGHVEWTEFATVARVPSPGEIVEARESWREAAGGGAVAAVQISKLAGSCRFLTALGDDADGRRAAQELSQKGVEVAPAWRAEPQRRAFVHLDDAGERTITAIGERHRPAAADPLPWAELGEADSVYVTAADAEAIRMARRARNLVATVRVGRALADAGVVIDVLVLSGADQGESYVPGQLEPSPHAIVRTAGADGGTIEVAGEPARRWEAPPLPGPRVDSHGAGDSFAAGLTYALGARRSLDEAVAVGARCGAAVVAGRGPFGNQIADAG